MRASRSRSSRSAFWSLAAMVLAAQIALLIAMKLRSPAAPALPWSTVGVALGAGLAVALVLSRHLTRALRAPLRQIEQFATDVAAGQLDGRLRWQADGELRPLADALDAMAGELRRRLGEVTAEKEQLQAVLSGMVEGVLVLDANGRIVLANPRFREIFDVWGEIAGRAPLEVIRHAGLHDALREADTNTQLVVRQIAVAGVDERAILVHAAAFPIEGPRLGTVVVLHDVSELRRLEGLRRDFLANVSHELRTPLTAIRGFAEMLLGAELPADDVKKSLAVIVRQSERLSNLIEDLLELSRIESRKVPLRPAAVDVARVAATVASDLEPQARARSIEVSVPSAVIQPALADRRALEQILTNLLDNAIKYTNPGGHVALRMDTDGDRVRIEVVDDGIGIPAEDIPRIFERFYRVDKARSRDLGGTGLGLAIVKHLVQAMDGEVGVRSEPAHGSTFWFTLPVAPR